MLDMGFFSINLLAGHAGRGFSATAVCMETTLRVPSSRLAKPPYISNRVRSIESLDCLEPFLAS